MNNDIRYYLTLVWKDLDTPIYDVLNENGQNVNFGRIRQLDNEYWLYVDELNGFCIIQNEDIKNLKLCRASY